MAWTKEALEKQIDNEKKALADMEQLLNDAKARREGVDMERVLELHNLQDEPRQKLAALFERYVQILAEAYYPFMVPSETVRLRKKKDMLDIRSTPTLPNRRWAPSQLWNAERHLFRINEAWVTFLCKKANLRDEHEMRTMTPIVDNPRFRFNGPSSVPHQIAEPYITERRIAAEHQLAAINARYEEIAVPLRNLCRELNDLLDIIHRAESNINWATDALEAGKKRIAEYEALVEHAPTEAEMAPYEPISTMSRERRMKKAKDILWEIHTGDKNGAIEEFLSQSPPPEEEE